MSRTTSPRMDDGERLRAEAAEAEFHDLVATLARKALQGGDPPANVKHRIVHFFSSEPTFRDTCPYEQERVVSRMLRVIDDVIAASAPAAEPAKP